MLLYIYKKIATSPICYCFSSVLQQYGFESRMRVLLCWNVHSDKIPSVWVEAEVPSYFYCIP